MRSSLFESVISTEFQATETHENFDLTETKYGIRKLPIVVEDNSHVTTSQWTWGEKESPWCEK
jgi:hypothetical protein